MTRELQLIRREMRTDRIVELVFRAKDGAGLAEYAPGAHLRFALGALGDRAYSLVDPAPCTEGTCRVAVQLEPDGTGGSQAMHALQPGDVIAAEGPKNDFALGANPALLLAGGIGVTPLMSMAQALVAQGRACRMVYAGRSRAQMAYVGDLEALLGDALQLHCDAEAGGVVDLATHLRDLPPSWDIYICGPRPMIAAGRAAAEAAGIAPERVQVELFESAATETGDQPFEVEIASTGAVVTVAADQTIVEALEEAGVDVMYDCQRGDCGICQVDVLEGVPDHRDVVLSDSEKAAGQVMQICVSRARTPRLKLDI